MCTWRTRAFVDVTLCRYSHTPQPTLQPPSSVFIHQPTPSTTTNHTPQTHHKSPLSTQHTHFSDHPRSLKAANKMLASVHQQHTRCLQRHAHANVSGSSSHCYPLLSLLATTNPCA